MAGSKQQKNTDHNRENIFKAIQDKYSILQVAQDLGLHVKTVGHSFRSDSIAGGGRDALILNDADNRWHDFKTGQSGDIADLVAQVQFNGDIKQALQFLMPDWDNGKISQDLKAKSEFAAKINRWHSYIFNTTRKHCPLALDYLHKRGINDDTIRALKIGVSVENGGEGFRIVFPYWDEAGKQVLYYATRRYDWNGNGEETNDDVSRRYKYASLEYYPFLHNVPLGLNTLSRKKDDTLIITEGIFDWLAFYQEGYSVLALKDDKLWKHVLDYIKNFKRVILAYDNDNAGQNYTYEAAKILLQHKIPFYCTTLLTKDVAEHYQTAGNLDAVIKSVRQGFSWFTQYIIPKTPYEELTFGEKEKAMEKCKSFIKDIAIYADPADVHNINITLRSYFPKDFVSGLMAIASKGPAQTDIRDSVRLNHNIMFNPRTGFYEYRTPEKFATDRGIWQKVDDETIMGYISNALGRYATGGKLSSILKLLQADCNVHSDKPVKEFNTLPLINVINGTLHIDINTGEVVLKPHSMYDYVTVQLPVYYNENAKCPLWRKFVSDITNEREDDQDVLQEFTGYSFLPNCKFQKALMLKGGGSNGKSVFFNIIKALLGGIGSDGRGYVSATEMSKWSKDFRLMPLRHSWLNISYDMEADLRGAEGIFKKVTAGEVLEDSYKHKDPIAFNTRSKLMMAANFFPQVNDTSDGFMRRWLIVELPMHFVDKGKVRPFTNDRELDPNLEEKLMKELPGILNWMLEGLQRLLRNNKFTHTANHDRLIREFRQANDPLYSFVEENEEAFKGSDEGHIVPRFAIFTRFSEWAEKNRILPLPSNRFYSNMRSIFNNLSIPFDEDKDAWIFFFKNNGEVSNW